MSAKRLSPAQRAPYLSDSMQVRALYREQCSYLRVVKLLNPRVSKKVAEKRLRESLTRESASDFAKPWHLPLLLLLLDSSNLIAAAFGDAKLIQAEEAAE